jgi:NADH-quinone oxidoreductase subunit L
MGWILILLLAPLVQCVALGVLRWSRSAVYWFTGLATLLTVISAVAIAVEVFVFGVKQPLAFSWEWIPSVRPAIVLGAYVDALAAVLLVLVAGLTALVRLFSMRYLAHEPSYSRYFALLGLFEAAMLVIILAPNLVQLFIGWELVGISSFGLIGFWHERPDVGPKALKALLYNRVGDVCLIGAILALYVLAPTQEWSFADLQQRPAWLADLPVIVPVLLVLGAVAKSGQIPYQNWLPDAMVGPTPVSALLHAATMVTAGVILMLRVEPLLSVEALQLLCWIGTLTAFVAALCALAQQQVKAVLAFSTLSHLGWMYIAIGTGNAPFAALHLLTHAFAKCALFLTTAYVSDYLHQHLPPDRDPQALANMGGLRLVLPMAFVIHAIAALSLVGVPLTGGFLSKEGILAGSLQLAMTQQDFWHLLLFSLHLLTVLLGALYMLRLTYRMYFGPLPAGLAYDPREAVGTFWRGVPMAYAFPLVILGFGSTFVLFSPIAPLDAASSWVLAFWKTYPDLPYGWTLAITQAATAFGCIAFWLWLRKPSAIGQYLTQRQSVLREQLYSNSAYELVLISPVIYLSKFWAWFDSQVIDKAINLIAIGAVNVPVTHNPNPAVPPYYRPFSAEHLVPQPSKPMETRNWSLAGILAKIDQHGIDGIVNSIAQLFYWLGQRFRAIQSGNIQAYLYASVAMLAIIVAIIILMM